MNSPTESRSEAIRAFLPAPLIREWADSPSPSPVWGRWITGALIHCDITGFTAMSESLAALGNEGAEIMASVLNRFFDRMLALAAGYSGYQIKFGGDAMLLLFADAQATARAGACGLQMQQAMRDFRRVSVRGREYGLRMRIGIHSGRFFSASVGDPDLMLHYMLVGPDVSHSATVEAAARPGTVFLSTAAADQIRGDAVMSTAGHGLWLLRRVSSGLPAPPATGEARPLPAIAHRYLLPPIQRQPEYMDSGLLAGEHRRVTSLFINLLGLGELLHTDAPQALRWLNSYVSSLMAILERHGGVLAGTDVADHGDKLIALFGAPVSREGQEVAAARSALEIDDALSGSGAPFKHRIGINSGFAFAGEIGSNLRRDYTVIGDTINLAARLMAAAAPGETIVSAGVAAHCGSEFSLARLRPLRVKGKAAPVHAFRVLGRADPDERSPAQPPEAFVGRGHELGELQSLARKARRGRPRSVLIRGEAGIGKSALAAEFARALTRAGWTAITVRAQPQSAGVPLGLWPQVLRHALFPAADSATLPALRTATDDLVPGLDLAAPLLAGLLGVESAPESRIESLDVESRRSRLVDCISGIMAGLARRRPLLLLVDDADWADTASLDALEVIRQAPRKALVICLTGRSPATGALRSDLEIELDPLPDPEARRLLDLGGLSDDARADAILRRAQGNPFFLHELALVDREGDLPETVNDVLMARLDNLDPSLKALARVASVAGTTFDEGLLGALTPAEANAFPSTLRRLVEQGFIQPDADPGVFSFRHTIARDVVYESVPFSQRRRLHGQAAAFIESTHPHNPASVSDVLLYHSEAAEDTPRIVRYAALSGDRAAAVFANEAALAFYDRSLATLATLPRCEADRTLLLERIGDCREMLGEHRSASSAYLSALEIWTATRRRNLRFIAANRLEATREAALCRKIAVSLERASEFTEALSWLERALSSVPPRHPRLAADICAAHCVSLFRKGQHEEGITWGRKALDYARRSGDQRKVAYARNMLATCFMERGDLRRAIRHLRQAVRIYHELQDFPGQASANNNLGMCYHLQGILDAALYHYRVALSTDERVGDKVDSAIVQGNIGEVLLALGRNQEAIPNLLAVVQAHAQGAGLAAVAGLAHVNLSRGYLALGDPDESARHLRRARRLLAGVGAEALFLEAELQAAELSLARGRTAAAAATARRALSRLREMNAQLLQARGERILGDALSAAAAGQQAERHLRESILLARRVGAAHEEARSAFALARHFLRTGGQRGRMRAYLDRAEKIFRTMGAEAELRDTRQLLGRAA